MRTMAKQFMRNRKVFVHRTVYQLCVNVFTIVYMEHMTPINRPLALVISFHSDYKSAGKAISVHKQVIAI